jgi:excisionase family DNA binding protein
MSSVVRLRPRFFHNDIAISYVAGMSNTTEPVLIRPSQAALMLSVSRSTIYQLIASGSLRSVRLEGRMIRVPMAAIRELAERTEASR